MGGEKEKEGEGEREKMFANVKNCYHSSQAFGINLFTYKFESNLSFLICKLVCSLCAQLCQISDSSRARNWHSKGRGRWFVLWRTILHSEIRGPSESIRRRKRSHYIENDWSFSGRPSYFVGFMVSPKGIDKFVNLPFCLFLPIGLYYSKPACVPKEQLSRWHCRV